MTPQSARIADADAHAATPTTRGRYLYCIVEAGDGLELGPVGIGDETNPVYTVHHGGFAAVVSATPHVRHHPNRENLLAHEHVVEAVMQERTVIPMSFGTVLADDADVVALLRGAESALTEALTAVRGRIELGLNAVWDRDRVVSDLEAEHEPIRTLKDSITREGNGSSYFPRVQLGQLVEQALETRAHELMWGVYEPLRSLSVSSRAHTLIGDDMLLNLAFLVDRAREDEFNQAVHRLTTRYEDLLSFKYTGPWPPYSFLNLRLELEHTD
jgi:hypothetical protein